MNSLYPLLRPLIFRLDPETAHHLTLSALNVSYKLGLGSKELTQKNSAVEVMGLKFPTRLGLAAGLDKNGDYLDALATLGFGFIEIGTVTPRPQPGNPKPRLFRLPQAKAIINRMGFNNEGVDHLIKQIQLSHYQGIVGINIGKNFDTPIDKAVDDYLLGMRKIYPYASYIAVNISSPNTANLRELQQKDQLGGLLSALKQQQKELAQQHQRYVPVAVKIAPDMGEEELKAIAETLLQLNIDGVIATNTTVSRNGVENVAHGSEQGGLSGAPLTHKATDVVRSLYQYLGEKIPIIAVGGIMSANDAMAKINAGAKLVQIYTGLIYRGPKLIKEITEVLDKPSGTS